MKPFSYKSHLIQQAKRDNESTHKIDTYVSPLRQAFCQDSALAIATADIPLANLSMYLRAIDDGNA